MPFKQRRRLKSREWDLPIVGVPGTVGNNEATLGKTKDFVLHSHSNGKHQWGLIGKY